MVILSFISMYFLMFSMVDSIDNIYIGINQFYMAGLMTASMIVIELFIMSSMYVDRKKNIMIFITSVIALFGFFFAIRNQNLIYDDEFLKSMIPHHAGAILMCQRAKLQDAEIKELCSNIILGQQVEVDFMKNKLNK